MSGNKLEGNWGEIVALGAEISPYKEPREKWSLLKNFFFFFFNFISASHVNAEIN